MAEAATSIAIGTRSKALRFGIFIMFIIHFRC
jgi:hypothetical protein